MDFKKALGQTMRELKREVNRFRLPEAEIKVQEATSNEPWGPHGSLMGEIADASNNPNDVPVIMTALEKRLVDTGKDWRHVYKAMAVMEFLVANGSMAIVEEIVRRIPVIIPLKEFQFVEQPSGRDQGINVRKKAETLLTLFSDRERINEVRKKAAANKNKYQGIGSNPEPEQAAGRLEDDDWQKPMQQGWFGKQPQVGGAAQQAGGIQRRPPPSYEEAMRSSEPVDNFEQQTGAADVTLYNFDPRGEGPSCEDGACDGDYGDYSGDYGASAAQAPSSINSFTSAALPPLQGSYDKVDAHKGVPDQLGSSSRS